MSAPSRQPDRDNPGLADIFTAMPVAALLIAPDNRIVNANARAESLFNMAKSAIIGGDVAHMVRIVDMARSEEHTSELQSLMRISYAVFCLKNKKINSL